MDSSLFTAKFGKDVVWALVYVDDIIVTGSNPLYVSQFITKLHGQFSLKDLGPLSFFLGIEATWTPDGLHLTQRKYIRDLLVKTDMANCKTSPTPSSTTIQLSKFTGTKFSNPLLYRNTIGALQYILLTQLELSFIVNKLSQFMQHPLDTHWAACKRVLRYLQGTNTTGLHIRHSLDNSLYDYMMLTEIPMQMTDAQLVATVSSMVIIWFPGLPKNKM